MKREKKKTSVWQRIVTLICLGVFIFSAYKLVEIFYDYYSNRQVLAEIQSVYVPSNDNEETEENEGEIRSQFNELLTINSSIVGWITIENTMIDYPILQAEDNDYYLDKNYKHKETRAGSIFMDYRNEPQGTNRHTIIYGHRMKDGSMFGQLDKFLEQDFYENNKQFFFDTLYEGYEVEVFSAYVTTTDFYYIETEFANDDAYLQFLHSLQERSMIETDTTLQQDDQIITLSTCDYGLDRHKGRLVLHGKLTKR